MIIQNTDCVLVGKHCTEQIIIAETMQACIQPGS
jgi:hypothetical protein